VLAAAGLLVAAGLALHPLPAGGLEEQSSVLATTPLWGAVHVAIAAGFVLCALGGLLQLVGGGPPRHWIGRLGWGAITIGMVFFTGVAQLNAWVMHPLGADAAQGDHEARLLFDAFNRLLVGYGWLGNPLFLAGLTAIAAVEVFGRRQGAPAERVRQPRWLAWAGLICALLSWLRGIGSATGLYFLEPFVLANIPAFLWLGAYGLGLAALARRHARPEPDAIPTARTAGGQSGSSPARPSARRA
jgi:hypothetical protein